MKKIIAIALAILAFLYIGMSIYAIWPVDEYPAKDFAVTNDKFVRIGTTNLRYRESGNSGNPAIVLIHGFAGSVYTFRKIVPQLEEDYHVFALDMPGFGLSDKPSDYDYSYKNQGETISSFVRHFKLQKVTLAGHSMGGNVVINAALENEDIAKLILLDPGIIEDGNPDFLKYLVFPLTRISAKLFRDRDFRMSSFEHAYYRPQDITEDDIDAYMVASRTENFVNAMVSMLVNYSDPTEMDIVPYIEQPVLILWGEHDRGNPPNNGLILQNTFRDAEFHIIKDSGHYIHEEQPDVTVSYIRMFIDDK